MRILTKIMMTFWMTRMTVLRIKRWKMPVILVIKEVTSQREMHRSLILHLSPARCDLTSHKQAALVKEILDIACAQVIEETSFKIMNEADDGAPISREGAFTTTETLICPDFPTGNARPGQKAPFCPGS